jgi:hypothetical protein
MPIFGNVLRTLVINRTLKAQDGERIKNGRNLSIVAVLTHKMVQEVEDHTLQTFHYEQAQSMPTYVNATVRFHFRLSR